ncbi:MAG: aromatic ring-hydroxylating dioxygenase subunit alpha [Acidobacteria bacterium]|nr:aromatic ring-hydroxylating dioxygenase subunit alpha [Acidobacteriota bacterium]
MKDAWYIVAESREVGSRPVGVQLLGEPLVLFRPRAGGIAALRDYCPHRGMALSHGVLEDGALTCVYHGWRFDGSGTCVHIPANREDDPIPQTARVAAYRCREQQGYAWVWPGEGEPAGGPPLLEHFGERGWNWTRLGATVHGPVDQVVENFIDNPHTGYVHGGLFRNPASHLAHHTVRLVDDGVVIDIEEEGSTDSLLGRVLLRRGQKIAHQDRFVWPSTVRVAYTFGERWSVIGTQFCTPLDEGTTRVFVHVAWSLGWLTRWAGWGVRMAGRRILAQDLAVLDVQGEQLRRLGREFCSIPADTAAHWIASYRRHRAAGDPLPPAREKRVTFRV